MKEEIEEMETSGEHEGRGRESRGWYLGTLLSSHSLEENKNYDIPQRPLPSGSVLSNKKLGHKASHFLVQPHVDTQSE